MLQSINRNYFILLCVFNCAILIGIGSGYWSHPYTNAFILCMVGLQFLSPKFWWTTFLSIISVLLVYIPIFPRITNHGNLEIFISIFLFVVLIVNYKRIINNTFYPKSISSLFRYSLVAIYFMAGLHKLNAGFFDLSNSCSIYVNNNLNVFLFGDDYNPSSFFIRFSQIMTIVTEMVVPIGLLHYKTRKVAAWLLVLFHFYLSLCGFSNFSSLAGFLIAGSIMNFEKVNSIKKTCKEIRVYIFFSMLAVLLSFVVTRFHLVEDTLIRFYNGLIFNIGWLIFFYLLLSKRTFEKQRAKVTLLPLISVVFIILWSGQTYLGLSNSGNLTMFSNIVTEETRSNHYIFDTEKTKIWNFEEDLVTIINIPDDFKWEGSKPLEGFALPLIEFKTQIHKWSQKFDMPIKATIKYKGQIINIEDLRISEFNTAKWWHPLIHFRRIAIDGPKGCSW